MHTHTHTHMNSLSLSPSIMLQNAAKNMAESDPSCLRTAKAIVMDLDNLFKHKDSALYRGELTKDVLLVELKSAAQVCVLYLCVMLC